MQNFLWGNFMWQKQDQKVELFPGKFWENIIKVSLNEDKNSRIFTHSNFFSWGPFRCEGSPTKSGAPRVLKIFFINIFSYFSLSVWGGSSDS